MTNLNNTVSHLSGDFEDYKQITPELAELQNMFNVSLTSQTSHLKYKMDKLDADMRENFSFIKRDLDNLNASMREDLRAIDNQLQGHNTQMTSELAGNMTSEIATLQTSLQKLTTKLDTLDSKVDSVNRVIDSQLEEHKQQTASELAGLQSNMTSILHTMHTQQLTTKMELSTKVDTLDTKLVSANADTKEDLSCIKKNLGTLNTTMNEINANVMEHEDHMTTELMNLDQNLEQNFTLQLKNSYGYITPYQCGGTGGWRRVVYLDMTDPNTTCPSGWQLTRHSKKTCGRVNTGSRLTCDSVTFPVSGGDYTRVCGRIKGYQYRVTDAFEAYHIGEVTTIDGAYVSGVSLTHGSPQQHIWTFAAGITKYHPTRNDVCPCDATINITIPPFVGGDYFCESGRRREDPTEIFFPDDPLWDGDGCTTNSTCCTFNNPPYFTKLPSPTTDDIEARMCQYNTRDDTPIELIELYVQ